MKNNGNSENHQNNNLKVIIALSNLLGKDNLFYEVNKKEQF